MTDQVLPSDPASPENSGNARREIRYRFRYIGIVVALILLIIAIALILRDSPEAVHYTMAQVQQGDLTVTVIATGKIKPVNQVDVGTEISGTIETIEVDYNDAVKTGQVLARLDTEQLEAKLRQSQAALALAEARVIEARATVTETGNRRRRIQDLVARGLASREELDTVTGAFARAEAGLTVAAATVDQAQAQQDADRRTLEKAVIRSPINGVVLERRVETGQTVAATLQTPLLFVLAEDLKKMVLHVDVDEADVAQVRIGQSAEFTVDAYPEQTFPARIEQIRFAPKTIDGVVSYEVLLSVDNTELRLLPGMTATAGIVVMQELSVVLVPNAALRFVPDEAAIGRSRSKPGGGGLFGGLVPAPTAHQPDTSVLSSTGSQVWTLRDGQPIPIPVMTGASNGLVTRILDNSLTPGMEVLTDMSVPDR